MSEYSSEYQKEYYQKNKDKILDRTKKYKEENKDKIKKQRENYKEIAKIKNKEYRDKNKEKVSDYNKNYRKENKEQINFLNKKSRLKNLYGINPCLFREMLIRQNNKCPICENVFKNNRNIHVDHNHVTGEVRMLLCKKCNQAIGFLNEDIKTLENAIVYIKLFNEKGGK